MTEEERKKEERSRELRAALKLAGEWSDTLRAYGQEGWCSDFTLQAVAKVEAGWLAVVSSEVVADAFWEQLLASVEERYLGIIKAQIKAQNIASAYIETRSLLEALGHYMECLGVEIPPEEEEVEPEVVVGELTAERAGEYRPWEELGITRDMWDRPLLELLGDSEEATATFNSFARFPRIETAGPALQLLNEERWRPGCVRFVGRKRLDLLREKLEIAGYFDQEGE